MNFLSIITVISLLGTSLLLAKSEAPKVDDDWTIHGNLDTVGVYLSTEDGNVTESGITGRVELGLKTKGKLGEAIAGIDLRGRWTNDDRVSKNSGELLLVRGFYNSESYDVQVGDVAQTYNMLVYTGTIKGATLDIRQNFSKDSGIKYSMIGGVQAGSWKDIGKYETKQRDAVAGEVKYTHARAQFIALSASYAKEKLTEAEEIAAPDMIPAEANTAGINFDWRFNRYIKTKGNLAWTSTLDTKLDEANDEYAGKIFIYTKPTKTIRSDFKYERYSAGYDTLVTRVAKNRERASNVTSWRITNALRTRLTFKGSRDNLDGKNEKGTSKVYDGSVSLTYRPSFLRRGDLGLRIQQLIRKGRGDDTVMLVFGASVRNSHKNGWKYGLAYDYTNLDNTENVERSNKLNMLKANIGYKKRFNEDNSFRTNLKVNYTMVDNLGATIEDQNRFGGTADIGWVYAKKFMFDLLYTSKVVDREFTDDNKYALYQISSQYKIFGDNSHVVKLSLKRRDSDGGTPEKLKIQDEGKLSYSIVF